MRNRRFLKKVDTSQKRGVDTSQKRRVDTSQKRGNDTDTSPRRRGIDTSPRKGRDERNDRMGRTSTSPSAKVQVSPRRPAGKTVPTIKTGREEEKESARRSPRLAAKRRLKATP